MSFEEGSVVVCDCCLDGQCLAQCETETTTPAASASRWMAWGGVWRTLSTIQLREDTIAVCPACFATDYKNGALPYRGETLE